MIVDDDESLREIFTAALELDGHDVVTAENGQDALDYLLANRQSPPDCIILDIMMPVMSGREFLNRIESEMILNQIPIVVCSAHGAYGMTSQIKARLDKPATLEQLSQTIGQILKLRPIPTYQVRAIS